jgi:hypothetical protein
MPLLVPPRPPAPDEAPLPELLRPRRKKVPVWRRVLYGVGAALAFVAGIVGWLVPVVTGIPFWIAGLVLLALAVPRTTAVLNALERRLPERVRRGLRRGIAKVPIRSLREAVVQPSERAALAR